MDGRFIAGSSWSNPNDKMPDHLPFVYGYRKRTTFYRALEQAQEALGEWKQCLDDLKDATDTLTKAKARFSDRSPDLRKEQIVPPFKQIPTVFLLTVYQNDDTLSILRQVSSGNRYRLILQSIL